MKKAGLDFEELVRDLFNELAKGDHFTSVEGPGVFLEGKDGKREFDVVLKSKAADIEMLTVIECKDYSRKVNVTTIDGFLSKLQDINANKGVLVSRKGFSRKAVRKAQRCGISLYVVPRYNHDEIARGISEFGFSHPVVISVINDWNVSTTAVVKANTTITLNKNSLLRINDLDLNELLRNAVFTEQIVIDQTNCMQTITPYEADSAPWVRDINGDVVEFQEAFLDVQIKEASHYFGYLGQLPNTKTMVDIIKKKKTTFFQSEDINLGECMEYFSKYSNLSDIPHVGALSFKCLTIPKAINEIKNLRVSQILQE